VKARYSVKKLSSPWFFFFLRKLNSGSEHSHNLDAPTLRRELTVDKRIPGRKAFILATDYSLLSLESYG
jgi:hypothetical protein